MMRLLAAARLSPSTPSWSWVLLRRETLAPTVARSVASWVMAFLTLVSAVAAVVVVEIVELVAVV